MSEPATRALSIWLDGIRIGALREYGNLWSLAYDPDWQNYASGFDLSPALPRASGEIVDGASQRPVQWFFDNLLPEENARVLLARDAGLAPADAFGLLQRFGRESAGALTLLPPGEEVAEGALQRLSNDTLSARIKALPRTPLSHDAPKRMSMAGSQHKLAVVLIDDELWEPVGASASTHILKPDHDQADQYPHSVANEWFVVRLAGAVGLTIPDVELRRVPEPIYLVKRFDRTGEGRQARRLHVLDACQLLSLDRAFKYQQATAQTLRELAEICRATAATRQALYRWSIFNLVSGNGDAHLKNLSFFMGPQGIELAPHYDMISTSVYRENDWSHAELVTPIGEAGRFNEVNRNELLYFADQLGLPASVGNRLLDDLLGKLAKHTEPLLEAVTADNYAGEARLLRQIVYGPMREMAMQLRPT